MLQHVQILEAEVEQRRLEALRHRVRVLCPQKDVAQIRSIEDAEQELGRGNVEPVGFLQIFNAWRYLPILKADKLITLSEPVERCIHMGLFGSIAFITCI